MSIKRQIGKVVALVCAVCFIAVFLFSAIHFADHSGDAGQSANTCQRTQMPECKCEAGITQMRAQIQTHAHNELHIDCFVCVLVQKSVDKTKQLIIASTDILLADPGLLIFAGFCFLFLFAGYYTPVKLKTRTNN